MIFGSNKWMPLKSAGKLHLLEFRNITMIDNSQILLPAPRSSLQIG